jgi:hypothetical protein
MAKQLVLALLCAAVAVSAARELSQAKISVSELPKQLQELNSRYVDVPRSRCSQAQTVAIALGSACSSHSAQAIYPAYQATQQRQHAATSIQFRLLLQCTAWL